MKQRIVLRRWIAGPALCIVGMHIGKRIGSGIADAYYSVQNTISNGINKY